ncbi:LytR C-terminal domain-containing protein [Isoptericola sp. NPDC019693]|uniref:LytR C-terminal domain-containing protein n=1 Tax=Isoptericola sp. NPDC019693 TaxID=3364009 RepID=UPI00379BA1EC
MSKSHYPYPPDEFDVRGPEGTPVGVHREPRSGWSSVWPFLLIVVVCGGLAVGIVSFLSDDGEPAAPPAAEQSAGAGAEEPEANASEDAPAEGEEAPADGEEGDAASEEPTDGESEEAATELPGDPAAANLAAAVTVYNDGAGAGQAAAGQGVLTGDGGFADVSADDAVNAPVELAGAYADTTVLYGADRADTASAVAEALGVDPANVQQSDDVTASEQAVWVVLKSPVG